MDRKGNIKSAVLFDREADAFHELLVYACPTHSLRDKCAKARVVVTILDENDNSPIIVYPSPNLNHTLHVPNHLSHASNATRVVAHDADATGSHSLLTYQSFDSTYFQINATSGVVVTTRKITAIEGSHYEFPVMVSDSGIPARSVNASIIFVFNSSAKAFYDPLRQKTVLKEDNNNMMIVIFVAVTSSILSAILVIAILFLAKSHNNEAESNAKKERKRNKKNKTINTEMDLKRNNALSSKLSKNKLKRYKQTHNRQAPDKLSDRSACCFYANEQKVGACCIIPPLVTRLRNLRQIHSISFFAKMIMLFLLRMCKYNLCFF